MTIFSNRTKLEEWRSSSGTSGLPSTSCRVVPVDDSRPVRWEKPGVGWIKCNVDAAFVVGSGVTSMDLCFRDTNGHFVADLTQWQQPFYFIVEDEALALLHAMKEATHRGFERVQFKSDSKLLVDAIHSRRRSNSEFSLIVNDIILLMSSSYVNFEVKFVRWQANLVAHTLARAAKVWASFHRFEIIPLCIEHLLVDNIN